MLNVRTARNVYSGFMQNDGGSGVQGMQGSARVLRLVKPGSRMRLHITHARKI